MHSPLPSVSSVSPPEARHEIGTLIQSALLYAEARLRIAALEGRDALRAGALMAVAGTLLFLSLGVAYAGGMLALAWWLSETLGAPSAGPAIAAIVAAHLLLAAGCSAWMVRAWRQKRLFPVTRKEFMEDKRWLEAHPPFRN